MRVARVTPVGRLALPALVLCSIGLRLWGASRVPAPWITPDEQTYAELGQSLYRSGGFEILGHGTEMLSLVYPALVGLPFALFGIGGGYEALKVLQAATMSLTAVPVYLWGRSLMSQRLALAAAALTLAVPGLAYAGFIMTEVAFYPLVCLSAWAMARTLAEPTLDRQAVLLGTILVVFATRLQAIVLAPILLLALALKIAFDRGSFRSLKRFAPLLLGLGLVIAVWAALVSSEGSSGGVLGTYEVAGKTSYGAGSVARYLLYHAADVLVMTAALPVVALALLVFRTAFRAEPSEGTRAFVAVAAAYTAGFLVQVALFASGLSGRIGERYLLALAPLLFLSFTLWLDRWQRQRAALAVVSAAALVLLAVFPFGRFVTRAVGPDSFSLIPLYELRAHGLGAGGLRLAVVLGAAALFALLALVPRRLAVLLPVVVFALLASASVSASRFVAGEATEFRRLAVGADNRWIDRYANGPVGFLYVDEEAWGGGEPVWANLFWNRSIARVYALGRSQIYGPVPWTRVGVAPDGRLLLPGRRPLPVEQVVASSTMALVGDLLNQGSSFVLWRVDPPARLSTRITGMRVLTGDIDSSARIDVYACEHGALALSLVAPGDRTIELFRDGVRVRTVKLRPGTQWEGTVPPPPGRGRHCSFELVTIGGGVHAGRFDFVRPT